MQPIRDDKAQKYCKLIHQIHQVIHQIDRLTWRACPEKVTTSDNLAEKLLRSRQ
jgi:hypothetical protein